jgi:hypothetical protein
MAADLNRRFPARSSSLSRRSPPRTESAPNYEMASYPPSNPQTAQLKGGPYEADPLAYDNSPSMYQEELHLRDHQQQAAHNAFSDVPYPSTGRGGSLDLADAYETSYPAMRTMSGSTNNSRSALRRDKEEEAPGQRTPIHPGASVQMKTQDSAASLRDRARGEKGGYRSPRNRSHDRGASNAGLGNWSGPAGGASPYGQLGNNTPNSGLASAASSNTNLQFAEGASLLLVFLFFL